MNDADRKKRCALYFYHVCWQANRVAMPVHWNCEQHFSVIVIARCYHMSNALPFKQWRRLWSRGVKQQNCEDASRNGFGHCMHLPDKNAKPGRFIIVHFLKRRVRVGVSHSSKTRRHKRHRTTKVKPKGDWKRVEVDSEEGCKCILLKGGTTFQCL